MSTPYSNPGIIYAWCLHCELDLDDFMSRCPEISNQSCKTAKTVTSMTHCKQLCLQNPVYMLHAIWEPAQSADCMGLSMQSADCMVRSLQTAWSPCRLKTPQKLAILFDNGYYSFSYLYLGETMTSLFARNERLLWRTRFSTTEMPSQFLTQYNTIKSWQFSLFSLKLSLQSTHVHVVRVKQVNLYDIRAKQASRYNVVHAIETVAAQSADCTVQSADCARFPDCMEHI